MAVATTRPSPSRPHELGLVVLTALLLFAALSVTSIQAAHGLITVHVDTTDDVVDPLDGFTSLREAVDLANLAGMDAEVLLDAPGFYSLTICALIFPIDPDEDANVNGDLDYTAPFTLSIIGSRGIGQACPLVRVLEATDPNSVVELVEVSIRGGETPVYPDLLAPGPNSGGGIRAEGDLFLTHAIVSGNTSGYQGGGAAVFGDLNAFESRINENASEDAGGALYLRGNGRINLSQVSENTGGGGIHADPAVGSFDLEIVESVISGNSVNVLDLVAGGVSSQGCPPLLCALAGQATHVTLIRSTVAENGSIGPGAGVNVSAADLTLLNSTVANNVSLGISDPLSPRASGVRFSGPGIASVVSSTITGNTPNNVRIDSSAVFGAALLDVTTTVIAQPAPGFRNCLLTAPVVSGGYNFADDASCAFPDPSDTNNGPDPGLGALANNGGPTPTRVPSSFSPLLNAVPVVLPVCAGIDQRGIARPQGPACEIGAVEKNAAAPCGLGFELLLVMPLLGALGRRR